MSDDRSVPGRRVQLLEAAARVIAERGFAETRLADVADAADLSAPLIVYYFGTRERLLIDALRYTEDRFYEVVSARLEGVQSPGEQLRELLMICCSPEPPMGLPQGWALWFELWSQSVRVPEAARNRAELDSRWHQTVLRIVRAGQAAGEFSGEVDADLFTRILTALLDGLSVPITLEDEAVTPEAALRLASELCSRFLAWEPILR